MDQEEPGGEDGLVAELTRYLAEQRVDAAAASRARERWLRQAAGEEAQVAGVLLDLAERADAVMVQGAGSRTHRGRVAGVGEDFAALRTGAGDVLLAFDALVAIRPEGPPLRDPSRAQTLDLSLAEALSAMAGDRPRVLVVSRDGTGLAGTLDAVGRDVLTLRTTTAAGVVYVPIASVAEITLTRAG